jgi:hypothetical protein
MSNDSRPPLRALLRFGVIVGMVAGASSTLHGQASTVSALAGVSLVSGAGGGTGARAIIGYTSTATSASRTASAPVGSVTSLTGAEAAALVQSQGGRSRVVVLYGTECPRSKWMFPRLASLAERHADRDVAFLTFSTKETPEDVTPFLTEAKAPFQPYYIEPGSVGPEFQSLGIHLPDVFNLPYIAVLDPSGRVVGEWDGATDIKAINAALSSVP